VHCYKIFGAIPLPFTPVARPKVKGNGGVFPCSILAASHGIGVFSHSIEEDPDDIRVLPPSQKWLVPIVSEYSHTQHQTTQMISEFYTFRNKGSS